MLSASRLPGEEVEGPTRSRVESWPCNTIPDSVGQRDSSPTTNAVIRDDGSAGEMGGLLHHRALVESRKPTLCTAPGGMDVPDKNQDSHISFITSLVWCRKSTAANPARALL